MKIVIDISEELYKEYMDVQLARGNGKGIVSNLLNVIKNGTPLPKEHGKIVDIGRIDEDKMEQDNPIICITMNDEYIEAVSLDYLNNLPAIMEADKESDENGIRFHG